MTAQPGLSGGEVVGDAGAARDDSAGLAGAQMAPVGAAPDACLAYISLRVFAVFDGIEVGAGGLGDHGDSLAARAS